MGGASSKDPHRTRTQFVAPSFGVELLLGSRCLFEVLVDVDDDVTDLAHSRTSPNRGTHAVLWRAGSWRRAWADRGDVVRVNGPSGNVPARQDQGQWTVVRRRLAARSRAKRPSCQ